MLTNIRRSSMLAAVLPVLLLLAGCGMPATSGALILPKEDIAIGGFLTPEGYLDVLVKAGDLPNAPEEIRMDLAAADYAAVSHPADFEAEEDGLLWINEEGWIEWEVQVPQSGYYQIGVVYDAVDDRPVDIVRGIQIDGKIPFSEAEAIRLKKAFVHDRYPFEKDSFGNHYRPRSILEHSWKDEFLANADVDVSPLKFYFEEGQRKLRMIGGSESMRLKAVYITGVRQPPKYAPPPPSEVKRGDWIRIVEAEDIYRKSNTSIQILSENYATLSPQTDGYILYNALGGEQFKQSGEWVEWKFEVPEPGYYMIGLKYLQAYLNQFHAFRSFTIDGEPVYEELNTVGFPYDTDWHHFTFQDETGEPMLFYLEEGEHTLRMTATAAPIISIYQNLIEIIDRIGELEYSIRKVTGNFDRTTTAGNVDLNRDWDLEKYIPDLFDQMDAIIHELNAQADELANISAGTSDTENGFRMAVRDLEHLKKNPRTIANHMNVFTKIQSNLGTWLYRLLDQPLSIDYLWVAQPGADIPAAEASAMRKFSHSAVSFARSFVIDYDYRRKTPNAIEVWVNRGRDYADLIQRLADETFTRETGIAVNVNLVPDPNLFILGNVADLQPDVALGLDSVMPVDFAMRGALLNLNQFPDYEEAASQFRPEQLAIFHYAGGDYALPEVQNFNIMLYRTDILQALELTPPETWTDVYEMLPTLQQNGYNFYVNPKDSVPFMYQNGAKYYTDDGLASALDSPEAIRAFRQWTDLFTLYQLPSDLPGFFTHFRLGNVPIGVVDFNFYLQVNFAAPELTGKWGIAPIPGTELEDGTIVRYAGGMMQAGVIFEKTERPEDAWAFLKWWMSEEIQARFGAEIEAQYGPEYRWNTANVNALMQLPWPKEHLEAIAEQLEWYREIPQVPGGYFTQRQLEFAWNETVINRKNAKEELEKAVLSINREMERKQIEFGLRAADGTVLQELDVIQFSLPGKEGDAP